jgi:hypothetical protein
LVTPLRDHWLGAVDPPLARSTACQADELGAITGHDLEVVDTSGLVNGPDRRADIRRLKRASSGS